MNDHDDPHLTRQMYWHDHVDAAAEAAGRRRYPRPEDPRLSRLDRWDRDPAAAPRPIRDPAGTARWVRAGLLVTAAVALLVVVLVMGVPR